MTNTDPTTTTEVNQGRPAKGSLYIDPATGITYRLTDYRPDWINDPLAGNITPSYTAQTPSGSTIGRVIDTFPAGTIHLWSPHPVTHLPDHDRRLTHAALLGQVDDNHAGGVYGWDADDHTQAADLLNRLTDTDTPNTPLTDPQARVIALSLLFPVHDQDHPTLEDHEWAEAETMLAALATEYGR